MPGSNAGTGEPLHFRCARCRQWRNRNIVHSAVCDGRGYTNDVKLTGKFEKRTGASKKVGLRHGDTAYEYRCKVCGHRGWSRHKDLRRLWWATATLDNGEEFEREVSDDR